MSDDLPCPFCKEITPLDDITTCDECETPLCVHCATTISSEDVVCPDCYREHMAYLATEGT